MNFLNKIKNLFGKKQDLSPNKKKLTNNKEIQKFFDKNSGWEKESITYFYDTTCGLFGGKSIKAYACFYRPATEEEALKATSRKLLCEIEQKPPQTLDQIWTQALKEIEENGELKEYVAHTSFKTKEQLLKEEKEVDEEISMLFQNYKKNN